MGYLLLLALSNGLDSHTSSFLCFKALNPSNVMYHQCFSYSGTISGYIFCLVNSIIQFEKGGVTFELWFVLFWGFFFFFCPLLPVHFSFDSQASAPSSASSTVVSRADYYICFILFIFQNSLKHICFLKSLIEDIQNLSWYFILLFLSFVSVPEKLYIHTGYNTIVRFSSIFF